MQPGLIRADSWHFSGPSPQHAEPGPEVGVINHSMPSLGDDAQAIKIMQTSQPVPHSPFSGVSSQPASGLPHVAMPKAAPAPGIPLRQESLEAIESAQLTRTKTLGGSQTLFTDVLEQLSTKEESLPAQAALYSLPSMQFLESLLDEMDSRSASAGCQPQEPPLYVSGDAFDLPGLDASGSVANDISTAMGGLPMMPRRVHSANAAVGCAMGGDNVAPVPRHAMPAAAYGGYMPMAPTAGSAAPSPQRGIPRAPINRGPDHVTSQARHAAAFLEELYGLEDNTEVTLQISKSGRVRKVTTFTGKRKAGDMMMPQASAPAVMCGEQLHSVQQHHQLHHMGSMGMEPESASFSEDMEANTEGPKRAVIKSKKSKRTVCLNCGSHQTPQWRCGPLGPRTLCNACGVRYKKGLPLNCWPLREGMVLPPGAVLPPTVQVPPGLNIITQPMDE